MTATKSKTGRFCRVYTSHRSDFGLTTLGVVIHSDGKYDGYHVEHRDDSTDVRWEHEHDASRSYTVTCSAYDGRPVWCDCPANHGRVICRHKAATAALVKRGKLHLPTVAGIVPPDFEYDFREAVDGVALAVAVK